MNNEDIARRILKGEKQLQTFDYAEIEDRLRLKLDTLIGYLPHLTSKELIELDSGLDACLRVAKLFTGRKQPPDSLASDEQPTPSPSAPKLRSTPDKQPESFDGTQNNPIPLETDLDTLNFAGLIKLADKFGVPHNEDRWLDDEWLDKEDELRVAVAEAMEKAGK